MEFHPGSIPTRHGKLHLTVPQVTKVMKELQQWKDLRKAGMKHAGPGPGVKKEGDWVYTEPSIWLEVDNHFDFKMAVPSFITHQVHVWFAPKEDIVRALDP